MKHKTLEDYMLRDKLDDLDITKDVRIGFVAKGVSFGGLSWLETEEVVEKAIKPLRDEVARLRSALTGWM